MAEGAKRVIAFRNTYRARAHQGVWTIKKPHRLVSSGVLVRAKANYAMIAKLVVNNVSALATPVNWRIFVTVTLVRTAPSAVVAPAVR